MDFCDQVGIGIPVVQAGMGGGITTGELAGTVSARGGLGTVGIMGVHAFDAALARAREVAGAHRPLAANLLTPFIQPGHLEACVRHRVVVVTFLGGTGRHWIPLLHEHHILVHVTVGTPAQARRALAEGADGLVAQGIEAGGHQMAVEPIDRALPGILDVAGGRPVLAAGGVAEADDVRRLLRAGATAVVAGTRFLLTHESAAHPEYKRRALAAERTLRTLLFSFGWSLPHRVIPNAATERWCRRDDLGPYWIRATGRITQPINRWLPVAKVARGQRIGLGIFTPALPLCSMPATYVDFAALYAGESSRRMHEVLSAADALARLTP